MPRFRSRAPVKEYVNSQSQFPIADSGEVCTAAHLNPGPAARTLRGGVEPETIAITDSETYQTLLARAQRRTFAVRFVVHGHEPRRLTVIWIERATSKRAIG